MKMQIVGFTLAILFLISNTSAMTKNDTVTVTGQQLMALTLVGEHMKKSSWGSIEEFSYLMTEEGDNLKITATHEPHTIEDNGGVLHFVVSKRQRKIVGFQVSVSTTASCERCLILQP